MRRLTVLLALALLLLGAEGWFLVRGGVWTTQSSNGFAAAVARLRKLPRTPADLRLASEGSFLSSDPLLDRIWAASAKTAASMVVKGPISRDAIGRPCHIATQIVIVDGWIRDRCPYIGDLYVTGSTLDVTTPHFATQQSMLAWFAENQHRDGAIPASPIFNGSLVLFDYNAYWIQTLYEYTLHSGNTAFARSVWPQVGRLMHWYEVHTHANGLLADRHGRDDYAFTGRRGAVVAYFNAQYVLALREAVALAQWIGRDQDAEALRHRADATARAFSHAFWDSHAGAFSDTTIDKRTHPQDGNVFAVLAGIASGRQSRSALAYLTTHNARFYGNTLTDSSAWGARHGGVGASERVYPFISYDEVLARFKRVWMRPRSSSSAANGVNAHARAEVDDVGDDQASGGKPRLSMRSPLLGHGWSSGAAPALSEYVLGVRPDAGVRHLYGRASPGCAPSTWARGRCPRRMASSASRGEGVAVISSCSPPRPGQPGPARALGLLRRKAAEHSHVS